MDAGQVVLQKQELDLSDVALEVVERLALIASKNQVRLSTGELPELLVFGDRQYLVQMLTNLVENAIKYSSGEDQHVQVETGSRTSEDGTQAWVRISDNGPGISPEHLPHLFDRFYQVDKARTHPNSEDENSGDQAPSRTGLGLAIVKWIVDAHGGEVQVKSEKGNGSIFEVFLPVVESL
jgi:signal transduction histidine kinase